MMMMMAISGEPPTPNLSNWVKGNAAVLSKWEPSRGGAIWVNAQPSLQGLLSCKIAAPFHMSVTCLFLWFATESSNIRVKSEQALC